MAKKVRTKKVQISAGSYGLMIEAYDGDLYIGSVGWRGDSPELRASIVEFVTRIAGWIDEDVEVETDD